MLRTYMTHARRIHVCAPEAHKERNKHYMEAVRQSTYDVDINVTRTPIKDANKRFIKGRPVEEFMDELAKRLGKHYGLNDIREAL